MSEVLTVKNETELDVTVGRGGVGSAMLQSWGDVTQAKDLDVTVGRSGVGSAMLQGWGDVAPEGE